MPGAGALCAGCVAPPTGRVFGKRERERAGGKAINGPVCRELVTGRSAVYRRPRAGGFRAGY